MEFWLSGSLYHKLFSFFTMDFWLSGSLSHELFIFSWWNSRYQEAFLTNFFFRDGILASRKPSHELFSFFTMEFWLSWSLSHELFLFSRWNSGYQGAFLTNLFLFSRWNSRYQGAFLMNFFLFSRWNSRNTQFGGRLFSYIYHKEYLHRIRLVKNLASWFRAPFARKRVWSSLF
jgi:hypothetical protein